MRVNINEKPVTAAEILALAGIEKPKKLELMRWIDTKIAEAEKAVKAREQLEEGLKTGSDAQWALAAKLHPITRGLPPMSKADRLKESATQGRIAEKCRRELAMFREVLKALIAQP